MELPTFLQRESLKRLLQGVALGAFATLAIGFSWGGWMLGSRAKTLADSTANSTAVAAIAPICVDQFQRSADAASVGDARRQICFDAPMTCATKTVGGSPINPRTSPASSIRLKFSSKSSSRETSKA